MVSTCFGDKRNQNEWMDEGFTLLMNYIKRNLIKERIPLESSFKVFSTCLRRTAKHNANSIIIQV